MKTAKPGLYVCTSWGYLQVTYVLNNKSMLFKSDLTDIFTIQEYYMNETGKVLINDVGSKLIRAMYL